MSNNKNVSNSNNLPWDNSILSDADLALPTTDPGFFQMLNETGHMFSLAGDFLDGPPGAFASRSARELFNVVRNDAATPPRCKQGPIERPFRDTICGRSAMATHLKTIA